MTWDDILQIISKLFTYPLFSVQKTPITLGSILVFLIFMTLFILLSRFVERLMSKLLTKRAYIEEGTRFTIIKVLQYGILVIGGIVSFQVIGMDLSALAVIFGLLSVGIGFGLQNLTSNFISGLILLFERPIKVGDRIVVGDIEGDVTEINIRSTTVRSLQNISVIVPNSEFVSNKVINWTHLDKRIRLSIDVGVCYSSNMDDVVNSLNEVAHENKQVLSDPEPEVYHVGFGDSSLNMRLWVWILSGKDYHRIRSELNFAIVRKFRERGIEIPFPQRDLHIKSGTLGDLAS